MTGSSAHTHGAVAVPSQREDSGTVIGPEAMDPAERRRLLNELDGESIPDLLTRVWTSAPHNANAYTQFVGGCIKHNRHVDGSVSTVPTIKEFIPDPALGQLPAPTKVRDVKNVLKIGLRQVVYGKDQFDTKGTVVLLGPVAELLSKRLPNTFDPKALADATEDLVEHGDLSKLDGLLNTDGQDRATTAAKPDDRSRRRRRHGRSYGCRRRNEPIVLSKGQFFVTPPNSRLSAYNGTFQADLVGSGGDTLRGNLGQESRDRRTLADVPMEKQRELLHREPLDWVPDKPVPTPTYEASIDWRPILEWADPLMAIYQLILTSTKRDDNAVTERTCAGMPAACELLCGAFGYKPQRAWDVGLNAGIFLEMVQFYVDSDLTWSDWSSEDGRARVILNHSILHSIMHSYLEFTMSPEGKTDRTFLISGKKANTRDALSPERKKRERVVNSYEPRIDPPETTLKMKDYLNGLSKQHVFTNDYAAFGGDTFEEMAEVAREIPDEERRRQELRKIYYMQAFPKPLYIECDRSPRLRAEKMNQLMNLKTEIRRSVYEKRKDRELDLSKAHLASYVPTVRDHGIDTPELDRYLEANLEDDTDLLAEGDLWMELAYACDTEALTNIEALRGAVKRLYSVPYGMKWSQVLHKIAADYAAYGGSYPDSHEPLRPLRSHPLVAELLQTRETLREIINEESGLFDAMGRFIPLSAWNETKDRGDRWRGLMSYINASYETEIIGAAFDEAIAEKESDSRTKFKIWLYQCDGFTIRVSSKASVDSQVKTLKQAVADKASELGVPTKLEVDWPE